MAKSNQPYRINPPQTYTVFVRLTPEALETAMAESMALGETIDEWATRELNNLCYRKALGQ